MPKQPTRIGLYAGAQAPKQIDIKNCWIVALTRLMRMLLKPLVFYTDLFLGYHYNILFLYFKAYPIILKGWQTQMRVETTDLS